jgi:alpha-mannosidase
MNIQHETQRFKMRLEELSTWRDYAVLPFGGQFQAADMPKAELIMPGQSWLSRAFPAKFNFLVTIPEDWAQQTVFVRLSVGGEGLLLKEGKALGGLNPYHREHLLLEKAQGGELIRLEVEAVPRGLFGTPERAPHLEEAALVIPDTEIRSLYEDLAAALDAVPQVGEEVAVLLLEALAQTFTEMPLPRTPTEEYLPRIALSALGRKALASIWEEWEFPAEPLPLPEALRPTLRAVHDRFNERLAAIRQQYPPIGSLTPIGHAHIDTIWLWPIAETRRKTRRTFATVLSLMERYPEYTYAQSQAQLYAFIEEDDPELFERVRACIAEGRWEPLGGMWVEADGNLLSGESWARQLLFGQRYFQSHFGCRSQVAWLPDTFGYSAQLPQLYKLAGLNYFFTTKLSWNETNALPVDLYWWEGLDGSRVLAHSILCPNGYNSTLEARDLQTTWRNHKAKNRHPRYLLPFGWGDGGGGPTAEMLERYLRFKNFPALPKAEMGKVEQFFLDISHERTVPALPVWVGEKYLELHRATYTTQAKVKYLHRRLEQALPEAEIAATLTFLHGEDYPTAKLEAAWKRFLCNQFHDVLPGSGIHTQVQETQAELQAVLTEAETLREAALLRLSRQIRPSADAMQTIVVWNLALEDRPLRVTFPRPPHLPFRLLTPDGVEVAYQLTETEVLAAGEVTVPGLGYLALSVAPGESEKRGDVRLAGRVLSNRHLRAEIGEDGTILSLFDKKNRREALGGRGNQIWAYTDIPRDWEAWDMDVSYPNEGREILAESAPKVVEAGPVRAGLRVVRKLGNSTIVHIYWLWSGARRLEIETHLHWDERRTLLRALFPLNVRAHEAWFETAFGAVPRPTHRNTSWDQARFEVPGHRFADLSEAGYGVSLLNDGKYGHSVLGNTLGLSLLRGPLYPDPFADQGDHTFTYALYPHPADWRSGTLAQAHDLNAPLRVVILPEKVGGEELERALPASKQFLKIDNLAMRMAALKPAEDNNGLILRLYEAHGGRNQAILDLSSLNVASAQPVNLLEEPVGDEMPLENGQLRSGFGPYQILTFRLRAKGYNQH